MKCIYCLALVMSLAVGCTKKDKPCPEFISIPGGSFKMGSDKGEADQRPAHTVKVSPFMMSKTEVTVAQYRSCVDAGVCSKPQTGQKCNWYVKGRENHPINCVDWGQARTFAKWIGPDVDLPTEAEWEYAAKGGQDFIYSGSNTPSEVGWYSVYSRDSTQPVGTKQANGYGLYDMSGNVWEWTLDEYHNSYTGAPSDGSVWGNLPTCNQVCDLDSARRVIRGGSWFVVVGAHPVAFRFFYSPDVRNNVLGFRLRRTR